MSEQEKKRTECPLKGKVCDVFAERQKLEAKKCTWMYIFWPGS